MARRVNKQFVVIFGAVLVVGLVAAVVLGMQFRKGRSAERAKQMAETADKLMAEAANEPTGQARKQKMDAAVQNYQGAIGGDGRNPELWVKLGDAYTKLTQYDVVQYIRGARQSWEKALEIDPAHLPALRRLMDSYYQEVQLTPVAGFFSQLGQKAEAVRRLDPKDRKARSLVSIRFIHQWLAKIETSPAEIDTAIDELQTMLKEDPAHPENADLMFYAARGMVKKGEEAKRGGSDRQADAHFRAAIALCQEALKSQEANAYMHYRFFEVVEAIRREDIERENTQRYTQTLDRELDRALKLVKPEDTNYVKIVTAAHVWAIQSRKAQEAEQILLDAQNVKPKDQRIRLFLAKMWRFNRDKRAAAIDLLRLPIEDAGGFEGVEARMRLGLEVETLIELTTMLIDDYAGTRELAADEKAAERKKRLDEIEAYYARVLDRAGEASAVLKLRGKIELLHGGNDAAVKAIKSFELAQEKYRIQYNGNEDLDLTYLLARAYFASGLTGQAKQQLNKFMERNKGFFPVRMMLAQILIREGDTNGARDHVEFLKNTAPNDPDVVRLQLAVTDSKDKTKITDELAKLPEKTRAEMMQKAEIARLNPINAPEESLRLYKLVLAGDPSDFEALRNAQELLVSMGKKDEALAMLREAQKNKPERRVELLIKQMEGASLADIEMMSEELIRELYAKEPLQLELKLYEFGMVKSKTKAKTEEEVKAGRAKAFEHLLAAEKIQADDVRVMDFMFQHWLSEQDWVKADGYARRLGEKNADQVKGLIYFFRLAMVKGDVKKAVEIAQQMTGEYKEFARSWVFLAQAQQAQGQLDQAIPNYTVALDKQSDNLDALVGVISSLYQLQRPNEAGRYIEQGRKSYPNNAFFREQSKNWQMNFGDPEKVLAEVKAERDAKPEELNRWIAVGRVEYAVARKKETVRAKFIADAKQTFTDAVKKWPAEKILWAHLVDIGEFMKDGAYAEGVLKQMAARPEFKASPDPLMMQADYYLRAGKPEQAEVVLKQAAETFKDNVDTRRRLAAFYTQNKKYDDALKLLDESSPDKLVRQQIVEVYMLKGDFASAERILKGLLQANDKDAQLHSLLAVVLLNQSKQDLAMGELNRSLELDPKNQAALYTRGQLRLKSTPAQIDDAIKDLVVLRDASERRHVEGMVALADAYRQKGQLDASAEELRQALGRQPTRRDIRMALVQVLANNKPPAWAEVERLLSDAERAEPQEPMWKRMIAKMLSARKQHEPAALKLRDAMALLQPNDPNAAALRGELVKDYFDILEAAQNWDQLAREVDQLFKTAPDVAKSGSWAYVKRGVARRNLNQKTEAMKDFETAMNIAQEAGNSDVVFGIIEKIALHMGKDAAIDRVQVLAAGKGTDGLRWKVIQAYLHFQNSEQEKALALVEEAKGRMGEMGQKDRMTALTISGTVYMLSGKHAEARAVYEELLKAKPEDVAALNNMACLLAEHVSPELPKAAEYSGKAYEIMQKRGGLDPNVLDTHGWVNVLIGGPSLDTGIDLLNRSINVSPIAEAHYHLGEAFMRKKMFKEARENLNEAQKILAERVEKNQSIDKNLKVKVDEAFYKAEKALSEVRASTP